MEAETDHNRRRLIIWWSAGGTAFIVVMALLFWAGFESGQSPESPRADSRVPADSAQSVTVERPDSEPDDSTPPAPAEASGTEDPSPNAPPEASGTEDPSPNAPPEEIPPEELPPDEESEQTSLQSLPEEITPKLPEDWDDLSPVEKINRNPFNCNLVREEVDLKDGQCLHRSTLSSKSKPWNPMALNLSSATEVENRPLKVACYNQDLTHLINRPSQPGRPGAIDWNSLVSESESALQGAETNSDTRSPVSTSTNLDNKGFRHCALRVVLEMTIDGFYFPNGCRTWRPGFIKLTGTEDGKIKTYDSLPAPGPDVRCTKVTVPIAKGQQIEQIFLFEVTDSDLDFKITEIRFDLLDPKITFSGNFGFEIGTKPPTINSP